VSNVTDNAELNGSADSYGWVGHFRPTRRLLDNPVFRRNYSYGHRLHVGLFLILVGVGIALGLASRLISGLADLTYTMMSFALIALLAPVILRALEMIRKMPGRASGIRSSEYFHLYAEGKLTAADIVKGESLPDVFANDRNILGILSAGLGLLVGWYAGAMIMRHGQAFNPYFSGDVHLTEFQIILWLLLYLFWMLSKVVLILMTLAFMLVGFGILLKRNLAGILAAVTTVLFVIIGRELSLRIVERFYTLPDWYRDRFFYFLLSPGWSDFRVSLSFAILEVGLIGLGAWIAYKTSVAVARRSFQRDVLP
jgi:hypothetical protein